MFIVLDTILIRSYWQKCNRYYNDTTLVEIVFRDNTTRKTAWSSVLMLYYIPGYFWLIIAKLVPSPRRLLWSRDDIHRLLNITLPTISFDHLSARRTIYSATRSLPTMSFWPIIFLLIIMMAFSLKPDHNGSVNGFLFTSHLIFSNLTSHVLSINTCDSHLLRLGTCQ